MKGGWGRGASDRPLGYKKGVRIHFLFSPCFRGLAQPTVTNENNSPTPVGIYTVWRYIITDEGAIVGFFFVAVRTGKFESRRRETSNNTLC